MIGKVSKPVALYQSYLSFRSLSKYFLRFVTIEPYWTMQIVAHRLLPKRKDSAIFIRLIYITRLRIQFSAKVNSTFPDWHNSFMICKNLIC